jgi:hypothetical protein
VRFFLVLLLGLLGVSLPGRALAADCVTAPSTTRPGISIADPRCEYDGVAYTGVRFVPLTDPSGHAISRTYAGILAGAAYRVEVPLRWNGDLMLYARGYQGEGPVVWVNDPGLRDYAVRHGFAWAASSFSQNGHAVAAGVADTHALIGLFRGLVGHAPHAVYLTGASMGGHVVAASIERYRDYAGAMPYCGVLGGSAFFDYYLDATAVAAALLHVPLRYTADPRYAAEFSSALGAALPRLPSTPWASVLEERSGGVRPGFAAGLSFWTGVSFPPLTVPLPFALYPGVTGGRSFVAGGAPFSRANVASNVRTVYRFAGARGPLSPAERALNAAVLRVPAARSTGLPGVLGDPRIPVLSLHDLGDLLVPFSMEQVYAGRVAAHRETRLFVSRAIRGLGHCEFAPSELNAGFAALVDWVRHGVRPAGDAVTDPRAVSRPDFGCRFTDLTAHPTFPAGCRV